MGAGIPAAALEFVPVERYVIQTLEELRTLASPLRLRILDCLIVAPLTVKQVGDRLGTSSKNLYYHVGELERLGLVQMVHAEVQSGIQVKYYRASAEYYYLTASMLHSDRSDRVTGQAGASGEFLGYLLEQSGAALRRSVEDGTLDRQREQFIVSRRRLRLSSERATALRDLLKAQEHELLEMDDPEGSLEMTYVYALFPESDNGGEEQ